MKLSDLIPSSENKAGLQGIERYLQSRRYTSRWSLIVALVSVTVQVAVSLGLLRLPLPAAVSPVILYGIAFVAAVFGLLARYTGFLFKQSKEPFRYTFCIQEFQQVPSTPGERFSLAQEDQLRLLRNDLTERLDRRVRRFSLLESPAADGAAPAPNGVNPGSHFRIEGDYAVRQESEGWILHVWPRVRIGPASNAFALAFPVRLPFESDSQPEDIEKGSTLNVEEYERLVERVYSSVATEIYKQIEIDLRDKMTMFPTASLRAFARYNEAEDFETSNTIDAYDRALDMYRRSLEELKASWWHRWWAALRRWQSSFLLAGVRAAAEAEAKTKLGYSRCLIYRRLASEMAGRERNPVFEVRKKLEDSRDLLRCCYNSLIRDKQLRVPPENTPDTSRHAGGFSMALALFPESVTLTLRGKRSFDTIRQEYCEAYAVSALAHYLLADSEKARKFLRLAEALAINTHSNRVRLLLLLAKAELEPVLQQKVRYLNAAREINSDFESVLYRLAYYSDLLARDSDEITPDRAQKLGRAYEAVLKVNPANIASLIGQGYLFWLTDDLDKARRKLEAGIELQKIVAQAFVGDLKYCLARVEVEQAVAQLDTPDLTSEQRKQAHRLLNRAAFDYEEATLADPTVAASYVEASEDKSMNSYYQRINRQMLDRYRLFATRTRSIPTGTTDESAKTGRTLLGYALNDYGNACLNYYLRLELSTAYVPVAKNEVLRQSVDLLDESLALQPNFMTEYNRFSALTWTTDERQYALARNLLQQNAALLPPRAISAIIGTLKQADMINPSPEKKKALQSGIAELSAEIELWERQDKHAISDPSPGQAGKAAIAEGPALVNTNNLRQEKPDQGEKNQEAEIRKKRDLRAQMMKDLLEQEKRIDIRESLVSLIRRTGLAPLEMDLTRSNIGELLRHKHIDWAGLGDLEVSVLMVIAQVWSSEQEAEVPAETQRHDATLQLCRRVLEFYYPEDYGLARTLYYLTADTGERERLYAIMDRAIKVSIDYDPQSRFYRLLRMNLCEDAVTKKCANWPDFSKEADYEGAIALYEDTKNECTDFPSLSSSLALAYQYRARQLANGGGSGEQILENSRSVLKERAEARRLDPANRQHSDKLLTALGRQLIAGNTFEDPLEQRSVPRLMEVEFSTASISDLGFTESGLAAESQQRVDALRRELKEVAGFTLPGMNFRDNPAFERGKFRFLIRGVPLGIQSLNPEADRNGQWDKLLTGIREAALSHAARFYSWQDCYLRLGEIAKADKLDVSDIQNHSDSLFALTWIARALLSERAPITDFASIAEEFRRCRARGICMLNTVEEIRLLPSIRNSLPGNSITAPGAIKALSAELEHRIRNAIDRKNGEPFLNSSPDLQRDVRMLAMQAAIEARTGCAVLLTSAEVRPFVHKLIDGMDVSVLSHREILPGLLFANGRLNGSERTQSGVNAPN